MHLSNAVEAQVLPSDIYRKHDATVLNMHLALFRALHGSTLLLDFYRDSEWEMFVVGEDGFRAIWEKLYLNDELLVEAEHSAEGLFYVVNNRNVEESQD